MPAPASSNFIGIHTVQRASSATARPLAGVFELLADQHRQALELLRFAGAVASPDRRRQYWAEARRRLISHERAEEQVVYAVLEGHGDAATVLEQHGDQAVELELAIAELDATDEGSDEWVGRLRDVMAMVDDHVQDEENEFFQRAQRLLGENTARELEEPYLNAQREVLHSLA
jgi:hemerythrin superfamily protein